MDLFVKIPKALNRKEFKSCISSGLYSLAVGDFPLVEPPAEEPVSAKINLCGCAVEYYEQLRPAFSSERALIRCALDVVRQLPEHQRCKL